MLYHIYCNCTAPLPLFSSTIISMYDSPAPASLRFTYSQRTVKHLEELEMTKCLAYSDDGQYLACGGGNGVLWIVEGSTGYKLKQIVARDAFRSMRWFTPFTLHGELPHRGLFCGLGSGHVLLFWMGGVSFRFLGYKLHQSSVEHIALCNRNQTLVTSTTNRVGIWGLSCSRNNSQF